MAMLESEMIRRLETLGLDHLQVINESSGHGGYYPGKESHFKVIATGTVFDGLNRVQRHQTIYKALGDLVPGQRIHALAIHTYTPAEWPGQAPASPDCAHAPK